MRRTGVRTGCTGVLNMKNVKENQGDGRSPLLLKAKQAAAICNKSERTWRTWDSAGRIPEPVRIGRSTLWRADELRDWVTAGCPPRSEWKWRK
jgi:predicted DNA-binding transcriptional regulator AlpA